MSGLMMPVIVYASDEPLQTAKVCQYMQCTVSENDGAQVRLRFNHTMWKQYSGSFNQEFDFTSWSWSELDSVAEANPTLEVTFNGLEVPHVDIVILPAQQTPTAGFIEQLDQRNQRLQIIHLG
ncbi:AGAP009773-PA [Anopheles gambiae str. PEST]|uniref:AGAP009773-PA n=1 Tax=Anopheles gambiae TaxID=7165 RepID=Q7Q1I8_ANOGA|nr:AGAP009773-PA [Anopheles gambiae str. PEST]